MIAEVAIVSGAVVIVSALRFARFVMQREVEEKKPKEIYRKTASKGLHEWTVEDLRDDKYLADLETASMIASCTKPKRK